MRVRAYTITVNVNHAPHMGEHEGRLLLTLANCKPGIREKAKEGEWVAAITPRKMGYRLAYVMRVGGSWTRADYWEQFRRSRLDSIYRPKGAGFELLSKKFHGPENQKTDTSCNRILWSNEFYYFAEPYDRSNAISTGLILNARYSALRRSMRTHYGHLIVIPDDFVDWVKKQPGRLRKLQTPSYEKRIPCGSCRPDYSTHKRT